MEDAGWEHLAPGVARRRLPYLDVTIGLIVGDDAVLLVDTGPTPAEGVLLRRQVRELTGRGVTHIALTHAHFDHVFGTPAFPEAQVFGTRGLDRALEHGFLELRDDAVRHGVDPGAAAEAADLLVRPGYVVDDHSEIDLGGGRTVVLVRPGPGHTDHDLAVLVPGTPRVLFCGDLVEESGEPQAGPDAVPGRWPAALDRLLSLGGEAAVYVPGHGAVVDARFVRAQRDTLSARFGTP